MSLHRLAIEWNGLTGLPGVSVVHLPDTSTDNGAWADFFTAIASRYPNGMSWRIPAGGDVIDEVTGDLTGTWAGLEAAQTVVGTGGNSPYGAGVGASVRWETGVISGGSRVRGRTFLTHLLSTVYDASGTIDAVVLTQIQNAATALAATGAVAVWRRPIVGRVGSAHVATGATVRDKVAWLSTRRD